MSIPNSLTALAATFLVLSSLACAELGSFRFSEESDVIEVQPSPIGGTPLGSLDGLTIPMEVNLEQQLEERSASGARSVRLRRMSFEMESDSDEEHFDFIDNITIEVSSSQSGSDLAARDLAWRDPVPEEQSEFQLEVDDDLDLKPYIEEGVRLRTEASGSNPDDTARFRVYSNFAVDII